MTNPLPPVKSTGGLAPVPKGRAVVGRGTPSAAGGVAASDAPNASPLTVTRRRSAQLVRKRERISLAGDIGTGKSYNLLAFAQAEMARAIKEVEGTDAEPNPPRFFYMDLDSTLPDYLSEGEMFESLYCDNGGNVYPYPCFTWDDVKDSVGSIIQERGLMRPGDWIVVDPINRFYEWVQTEVARLLGKNVDDAYVKRLLTKQGFGAFDAAEWQIVRRYFEPTLYAIVNHPQPNVLFLHHTTDVQPKGREKREILGLFDQVKAKPKGPKTITGMVDTVMFLFVMRDTSIKDNPRTLRMAQVVKDRGHMSYWRGLQDGNFMHTLLKARKEGPQDVNIVDPAEAKLIEERIHEMMDKEAAENEAIIDGLATSGDVLDDAVTGDTDDATT